MTPSWDEIALSLMVLWYFLVMFGFVYVFIPWIALGRQPDVDPTERCWCAFVLGSGYWVALVLVLAPFRLQDMVGLMAASVAVVLTYMHFIRGMNIRKGSEVVFHRSVGLFFDFLDESGFLSSGSGGIFRLLSMVHWRQVAGKWDYGRMLIWTVFLYAAYLRLYDGITHYSFGFADPYVHIVWLKEFMQGKVFFQGVYPRGYHAFLSVLSTVSCLDPALEMRFVGGVIGALLPPALFLLLLECRLPWTGALVGTSLMAVCAPFQVEDLMERQTSALPQEFALLFALLALAFGMRYVRLGIPRDRWAFVAGSFVTWAAHPLAAIALMTGCAAAAIDHGIRSRRWPERVKLLARDSLLALAAGNLFLVVGLLLRYPINAPAHDLLVYGTQSLQHQPGPIAGLEATLGLPNLVFILAGLPLLIFGLSRRQEAFPSPAFLGLWSVMLVTPPAITAFTGLNTFVQPERAGMFLTIPACGIVAWLYTLIVEPLLGRWLFSRPVRAGLAALAILSFALAFPAPIPIPPHPQYEEAAHLYYQLAAELPRGSWTLVGEDEDNDLSLDRTYHYTVSQFLSTFKNVSARIRFPTPYTFIILEKRARIVPHVYQSATRRQDEHHLQDWVRNYAATHTDLRVFQETKDVAIYVVYTGPKPRKNAPEGDDAG